MNGRNLLRLAAGLLALGLLSGCAQSAEPVSSPQTQEPQGARDWASMEPTGSLELLYADQFSVDYYEDGVSLITIEGGDRFLTVPQGQEAPSGLDEDITVLEIPMSQIYVASSSAMDLFLQIGALDHVSMTGTSAEGWSIPEIAQAVEEGQILYGGKYSAPDYEMILSQGCSLAVENTMIYHSPEVKEQLEELGIPVLVERSSYESHPLGRMEWMKLYGLLTGREEQAEEFVSDQLEQLDAVLTEENTGKTVAFFYLSSNGYANIRKPGDYVSKMIELAGGSYVFTDLEDEDNALSTMNMQMERFYAGARDADYLIYNSTVDGELETLDQLLEKSELLAEFKAVQEGNVWCTNQNLFQQTSGACGMILDFHAIISGEADDMDQLTYLHRLR